MEPVNTFRERRRWGGGRGCVISIHPYLLVPPVALCGKLSLLLLLLLLTLQLQLPLLLLLMQLLLLLLLAHEVRDLPRSPAAGLLLQECYDNSTTLRVKMSSSAATEDEV